MSVIEAIYFALRVYGIVIVISLLCAFIIWAVVHTLAALAKKEPAPAAKPKAAPAPVAATAVAAVAAAPAPVVAGGIPPEHVAAIAAAVYALTDGAAVLHIDNDRHRTAWVAEGRLAHHSSHSPIGHR